MLKYVFDIDEKFVKEIRKDLHLRRLASGEDGQILVWTGTQEAPVSPTWSDPRQPAPVENIVIPSTMLSDPLSLGAPTETKTNGPIATPRDSLTDVSLTNPLMPQSLSVLLQKPNAASSRDASLESLRQRHPLKN